MRAFLAILKDSFRESVDNRIFLVLAGLCLLFVLLILLVGFEDLSVERSVEILFERMEKGFGRGTGRTLLGQIETYRGSAPRLAGIESAAEGDGARYTVRFTVEDPEAFEYTAGDVPGYRGTGQELEGETGLRIYMLQQFQLAGFRKTEIGPGDGPGSYRLRFRPGRKFETAGAQRMTLLFGLYDFPLTGVTGKQVVQMVESVLVEFIGGWVGVIVAVLITAWFVPNMLRKGSIDLLLSKPVHRAQVITAKYVGGLSFVFLNAVVLIGGSWLAFGLKSGYWHPGYLGSVFTLTFLFAILYSVSTLVSVLFENSILSVIVTILFWGVCFLVNLTHTFLNRASPFSVEIPSFVRTFVEGLHYALPNTSDLGELSQYYMTLGEAPSGEAARLQAEMWDKYDFTGEVLSSVLFIVVVLALTCLAFRRRDF